MEYFVKGNTACMQVDHLLSPQECSQIIQGIEESGVEDLSQVFSKDYRDCKRLHTVDHCMSDIIMDRLYAHLPEIRVVDGVRWKLNRFTHHWRYVRYNKGGKFAAHWDGSKMNPTYDMTMFTVQVYLNDEFEGGKTRFYMDYEAQRQPSHYIELGKGKIDFGDIQHTHACIPKTGRTLVFNHCDQSPLHDAEPIESGIKYIMRGDVLYSVVPEDIPKLLRNYEENQKLGVYSNWCKKTAMEGGTRNFLGQVWVCFCQVDEAGAKSCVHFVNNRECDAQTLELKREYSQIRQKQEQKDAEKEPKLILINGKRFSGKDYVSDMLSQFLEQQGYQVYKGAVGNINKKLFARAQGLDYEKLMNDRQYKEMHRVDMIKHHQEKSKQNPLWAIQEILNEGIQLSSQYIIVSDLRVQEDLNHYKNQWKQMTENDNVYLYKVFASQEARKERGWEYDEIKDELITEVDFDDFDQWLGCIDNSDNSVQGQKIIEEWIVNTVLPRIQINNQ